MQLRLSASGKAQARYLSQNIGIVTNCKTTHAKKTTVLVLAARHMQRARLDLLTIYIYTHIHMHIYIYIYKYIYKYMYMCMYVPICICVYIHIYIYIYMYTLCWDVFGLFANLWPHFINSPYLLKPPAAAKKTDP